MKHLLKIMSVCTALMAFVAPVRAELYADAHLVQFVNHDGSIMSCSDINSSEINVHIEGEPGDYADMFPGDIVSILWDDCGTDDIYDDEIISIRYVGYLY